MSLREGEIRPAPAHRGVAAGNGHIARVKHMGVPQHDLQIAQQRRVIQRGRHLADAAADGRDGLAAGVGRGGLVAPFSVRSPTVALYQNFAGVIDPAVDGPGRQPDVLMPPPRPGALGGARPQHVPEHGRLQLLRGHGGNATSASARNSVPGAALSSWACTASPRRMPRPRGTGWACRWPCRTRR